MIKFVIFDFDDTLTDNRFVDHQSFVLPSRKLGVQPPKIKQIIQFRKNGLIANKMVEILLKNHNYSLVNNFHSIRKEFLQSYKVLNYLKLQQNTKSLLFLLQRKKIEIILCSVRKNKKLILSFLKKNKIYDYFDDIVLMEDLGFSMDNSNESNRVLIKSSLLHKMMQKKIMKPSESIFIGNSIEDVLASNRIRVPFIYYQNSYLPELTNKKIIKVKNMKSLRDMVKRLVSETQ